MKALTIKQPFASLIAEGYKEYEFRTWKTKYRGPLLIHAGKSVDRKAMKKFEQYNLEYPVSAIIAKAEIEDVIYVDDEFRKMLKEKNPLVYSGVINDESWEGYAFKLKNVQKQEPIIINGQLGLWNFDYEESR